ncbi:unnamed protein product [Thlaspi arvense]|uniref:Rapid ALkalinization Factor n=1 Tax=Thlaspi arvense TaxID=13288 RepID=A0AAU9R9L2_THLAR|nr:unnamed protein product [Thlaspi arvense]
MAASIHSSIVFFLLFIVFSLFINEKAFAAHMEHRKLCGSREIMTMRRNLQGNGAAKIGAHPSKSDQAGSKTPNEPSKVHPDQATPQGQRTISYSPLQPNSVPACGATSYNSCKGKINEKPRTCALYKRCKRQPLS